MFVNVVVRNINHVSKVYCFKLKGKRVLRAVAIVLQTLPRFLGAFTK